MEKEMTYPKLINYSRLTQLVTEYEEWKKKNSLDLDEEQLLLNTLKDRREYALQKLRMKDSIGQMPLGGLFKKAMNWQNHKDEGEEI